MANDNGKFIRLILTQERENKMTIEELEQQLDRWIPFLKEIEEKQQSRQWNILPMGFEVEAVKGLYARNKWRFEKYNIKSRILGSAATTFEDLIDAVKLAKAETDKR